MIGFDAMKVKTLVLAALGFLGVMLAPALASAACIPNGAWVNGIFYDGAKLCAADLNANNNFLIDQGGGTGSVNTGTANDLGYYATTGKVISPIASVANAIAVTSNSGVPSESTTLPAGLTIPVTAAGASASRSLSAYFGDTENVVNDGADPTGVANSTTAFQAAFSAKGNIFVPCGTYKLNATWASPIGGLLSGGGVGCTTLEPFSTGSDVLKITSGNFTTIKDLAVLTTSGNGNGIELDGNTGNTTLDNLSVGGSSPSNGFTNGVLSDGGPSNSGLYILGGWYLNNAGSGLNLAGTSAAAGANDYHIVGAQFGANATAGISATFANAGQITDDFLWSNGVGFKGANDDYIWLDRDRITQSGAQGVLCATCLHVNLQHGQYYQNSSTTVGAAPDVAFTTSSFVLVEGNDFFDWTNSPHTNYAITNDAGSSIFDIEQNDFTTTAVSAFTGSVSGTTLTWNTVLSTAPANGQTLYGASVPAATTLSGCSGSTSGTCTTSHSGSISSEAMAGGASSNVAHTLGATSLAGTFGLILRNNIPLTEPTAYSPFWSGNITLLGQLSATNQTSSGYALVGLTSGASAADEGGLALENPSTANNAAVQEIMECGVSLCGGILAREQGATQGGNVFLESANTSGVLVAGLQLDDAQNATFAAGVTVTGLASAGTQCVQVSAGGALSGTGSTCGGGGSGVSSFNTRTGAVTLSSSDVNTVLSADTLTGKLNFLASAAGAAGLNIGQGTAPTSPTNGDLWGTTAGLFGRFNGATQTYLFSGGALGTPSAATLTSATGLPISTGVSGLGTGIATALGATPTGSGSIVLATSPTVTGLSTNTLTSTVATGTAPFTVASTTNVANLNASTLGGATFAIPGPIGSTTPSTGAFTTETVTNPTGGTNAMLIATHGANGGDLNALALTNPSVASFTTVAEGFLGGVGFLAQLGAQENGTGSGGTFFVNTTNTSGSNVQGLEVDYNQHVALGGPAPAVSACGTGSPSISGTDNAGTITVGTSATACTLTFDHAYNAAPHCVLSDRSLIADLTSYTVSASAIALTMTSNSGNLIDYVCSGS